MRKLPLLPFLIALIAALIFVFNLPVQSASFITVTTSSDLIADDGLCSFREAIIAANSDGAFHDCPAGSGADSIDFADTLTRPLTINLSLTGVNEDNALTGDLDLTGILTIAGTGSSDIVIDGNGADRVFDLQPGSQVTISGVTVRNGHPPGGLEGGGIRVGGSLSMNNSIVSNNAAGGLFNNGGSVILNVVQITNNSGGYGLQNLNQATLTFDGGQVSGNQGGGISNKISTANLTHIMVTGNTGGGGLNNSGATLSHLTLSNSTVLDNKSIGNGGGLLNAGVGAITGIYNSTISGNVALADGGGIYNSGIMTIHNSTVSGNNALAGGGINHSGGTLSMINDTVSHNIAKDNGGGLYNRSSAILSSVTLTENAASGPDTGGNLFNDTAQLSIRNSIIANSDQEGNCFNSEGIINSLGYNLDSANSCGFATTGDLINTNPLLGPLQDNLGPTMTHALLAGSPAIDAANPAAPGSGGNACSDTDQRGSPRPVNGDGSGPAICDIGAFEYQSDGPPPSPTPTGMPTPVPTATPNFYFDYLPFVMGR